MSQGINPEGSPFQFMTKDPAVSGSAPTQIEENIAELLNQRSEVRRVDWLTSSGGFSVYGRNLEELAEKLNVRVQVGSDTNILFWL